MSRGTSPTPASTRHPPLTFTFPTSSSATSLRSPKTNLRVNVEQSNYRSRSNTSFSPPSQVDHLNQTHPRSMSHQLSPAEAKDVTVAVRNLRGDLDSPIKSHPLREMVVDEDDGGGGHRRDRSDLGGTPPRSRSRSGTPSRSQPASTDAAGPSIMMRVFDALEKSSDEGDTLDLSRQRIDRLDEEEVEMLRTGVGKDQKGVWRLALSYNLLRDGAIANSFSQLMRLRYLNLKGNHFSQIPEALTSMPSLEILDLSKNQIAGFPDQPGDLTSLKVLSLTHNRIYTLPAYLTTFDNLKVFKVSANPIEWPPKEVLGPLVDPDANNNKDGSRRSGRDDDLRPWIENMKSWMKQKTAEANRLLGRVNPEEDAYLASEEDPSSAVSLEAGQRTPWNLATPISSAPSSQQTVRRVPRDHESPQPGAPSRPSLPWSRSDYQASTSEESLGRLQSPRYTDAKSSSSHARHTSSSSLTPPSSATTVSSSGHSRNPSMTLPPIASGPNATSHNRGGSLTASNRDSGQLTAKKSLPDLRQSHAKIISERRGESTPAEQTRQLGLGSPSSARRPANLLSPVRSAYDGGMMRSATAGPSSPRRESPRTPARKASIELMRRLHGESQDKRKAQEEQVVDESRNSYFRRLSTLPQSSISKSIPPSLLRFVDLIRGILFALSQLHTALRQYINFALNERVAGLLNKIMVPASTYMTALINALDRFDSMSRRNNVPAQAVHGIIRATKESVSVFAKVISVLKLQSPAMRDSDVRYTRTLLLSIYGTMAEIARSWQSMTSLLLEIRPLLSLDGSGIARSLLGGHRMMPTGSLTGRTPISPIPERGESATPPSVPRGSMSTVTGGSPIIEEAGEDGASPVRQPGRADDPDSASARNRRQGGSFSTHDVQRGKLMSSPSPSDQSLPDGYMRHRPSMSAQSGHLGQMPESEAEEDQYVSLPPFPIKAISPNGTAATIPLTPPDVAQAQALGIAPYNEQDGRRSHKATSSAGSSHAPSIKTGLPASFRKASVDARPPTPTSATLYDEHLLSTLEEATHIAQDAWDELADDISSMSPRSNTPSRLGSNSQTSLLEPPDSANSFISFQQPTESLDRQSSISPKQYNELQTVLHAARATTSALCEALRSAREGPRVWAGSTLPDDAAAFIKIVIRVSQLVKRVSATHSFSSRLRSSITRLTQSARESAILLQVSSLRPTNMTPAPSSANSIAPTHRSQFSQSSFRPSANGSHEDLPSRSVSQTSLASRPHREGLRGLQLPKRQAAMNRDRMGGFARSTSASSGPVG